MIKSFDVDSAPDNRFGRQALLHTRGQSEVFLNFLVALLEFAVCRSQFLFNAFDVGNIGERNNRIAATFRILDGARADNYRKPGSVLAGQNKFEPVLAFGKVALALGNDEV